MNRLELVLEDFTEKHGDYEPAGKFSRLYAAEDDKLKGVLAYFHQEFNGLFEFMNYKSRTNQHYNTDQSRALLNLIEELEEIRDALESEGSGLLLEQTYSDTIQYWKPKLALSYGTSIPDDFEPIKIIKHEPVLEILNQNIRIPDRGQMYKLQIVGEGAFSIVQKYKDDYYDSLFAVKRARKTLDAKALERFVREFKIMKGLSFPYVLEVHSFDKQNNSYTMEYCDATLDNYISSNPGLSFRARKTIALQFLYGINYLHKKGILHRDLSYGNILIKCYDCGAATVKLSDFGLVKEEKRRLTQSDSEIKGTIIDPCLEKFKDYGVQNEIYAIGVILLFIFTGRKNLKVRQGAIYKILANCTNLEIERRYKNTNEIIAAVDELQELRTRAKLTSSQ